MLNTPRALSAGKMLQVQVQVLSLKCTRVQSNKYNYEYRVLKDLSIQVQSPRELNSRVLEYVSRLSTKH